MSSVNVILRARPFSKSEIEDGAEIILSMEKQKTYLNYVRDDSSESLGLGKRDSFSQKQFLFDRSFWSVNKEDEHFVDQQQIFLEYGKNVVQSAIEGYNACVFAYGQTGSGKSYTMMGTEENIGLIPRICQGLFKELLKMREDVTSRLEVSYMEIYNEQCRDLLKKKSKADAPQSLKVREHPKEGPFVQDLSIHPVTDYTSISAIIEEGNRLRVTAGTKMNSTSSRSHSIFMMKLTQAKFCGNIPSETVSKINLVDLAGSERISKSGASGIRLKEGGNINKSLTTLGLVISALAENSSRKSSEGKIPRKTSFVPYRDSILTWLLKDSIGGNSKTIMIATVSPASHHYGETLSTLRYASRARKIVNKPIINEDPNVKTIRELRSEIEKLRKQLHLNKGQDQSGLVSQKVEAKLKENEEKVDKLTKHWLNKITEGQQIFKEKCMSLSQQGQQTVLTSSKPHLVGLEVDPLSTDIVIYHLEEGKTIIGSSDLSDEQGIALEGSGIEQEHCDLHVTSERVILHPIAGATYINNQLAVQDWELRQGDILQFGHFWKFRFHNPMEAAMLREKRRSGRMNSLPDNSTSGRVSPAVMQHYRSLDSGLSSPDDFEQDFGYDHCTTRGILNVGGNELVLNSTVASQHDSSIQRSSPPRDLSLQVPCRAERIKERPKSTNSDLVILRSSRDTRLEKKEKISPKNNSETRTSRRQMLKSASASDILDKPKHEEANASVAVNLNDSDRNELYLSADQLTPRTSRSRSRNEHKREMKTSPSPLHRSPMLSPFGKSRNSSASDLSLSTDDLAFNFLLQSQMRNSSSSSSIDGKAPKKLSFPNYADDKTQSAWDLSPRKFEQETTGDIVQAESLSVLNRRSFNFEEFFVHADNSNSGSALAQEALDAADILKEKKEQLKLLIESYREAEISRVEIERENMRRARENEAIFTKQQHHLEDLLQQQKEKLREARADLGDFQKVLSVEKQHQRVNVENEVDNLMRLKQEHRACYDWSEHELRKKKFKLKVKIEEYWKRMDLYETLLLELELERNKVKQEVDEKLQERIKEYETQQQNELNEIREQIAVTKHDIETYTLQLEEEKERLSVTADELGSTEQDYDRKISDSERFALDVKQQEKEMLSSCKDDITRVDKKMDQIKEKLHHYTIYKMHECSQDGGDCCHNDSTQEDSLDCNLTEDKQRSALDDLYQEKQELETTYDKKVEKYKIMLQNAQDALADLRQDKITALEECRNKIADRKSVVVRLEQQISEETDHHLSLKNELKAHERPRSFISACPEESEEDVIANEQQIEQLLQSKDKVRKILEATLREEFNELKATRAQDGDDAPPVETESSSAVDKAVNLVFHAGNSSTYIESLIKKNNQYEQRRRVLGNIRTELQDLMKYQMTLHREVAENFLTQKSLFEEVRSQERKDIHDTIQTLILDSADNDDELLSHIFKESERIIEHQRRLDELENQMYQKITENYDLQERLDAINEKLSTALDTFSIENTMLSSENPELSSEYDSLNAEKVKCENLINELQERLFDERKDYLELLRSKDGYDVIGQEYRDERHTLFQTEGNKAAADALREVFMGENLMEALKKTGFEHSYKTTCGGWSYLGQQKDVWLFKKRSDTPQIISMMGRGIIKTSAKRVWETVRNPLSRLIYDKLIKKINIVEDFSEQLKVVYMQHQTRLLFVKQKKDCCCVHNERSERNKFIATHTSIEHPDCPERKNYSRLKVLPSGWIVEPYTEHGEDWSLVWYLIQIDVGKSYLPSFFIDSIAQKLPLSILSLRDYLILS